MLALWTAAHLKNLKDDVDHLFSKRSPREICTKYPVIETPQFSFFNELTYWINLWSWFIFCWPIVEKLWHWQSVLIEIMTVLWFSITIGFWCIIAFHLSQLVECAILLPLCMRDTSEEKRAERKRENINKERQMNKQTKWYSDWDKTR